MRIGDNVKFNTLELADIFQFRGEQYIKMYETACHHQLKPMGKINAVSTDTGFPAWIEPNAEVKVVKMVWGN